MNSSGWAASTSIQPPVGPIVDTALSTNTPGVFAIGNLAHPVDTADVAALDGAHVADHVLDWLAHGAALDDGPRLIGRPRWSGSPLKLIRPRGPLPARERLLLWSDEFRHAPVVVAQSRRSRDRPSAAAMAGSARSGVPVPFSIVAAADPLGGDIVVELEVIALRLSRMSA